MRCWKCSQVNPEGAGFCKRCGASRAPEEADTTHLARPQALLPQIASGKQATDALIGTTLHGYEIGALLGRGTMGAVHRARRIADGAQLAVKILYPELAIRSDLIRRFQREARALMRLEHPQIVRIHELFEAEGVFCIAMEYLPGGSLHDTLRRCGKLSEVHAASLMRQLAEGLSAAAEAGIVHRDIKPGNLLLDLKGRLKITDFGVAKAWQAESGTDLTGAGDAMGSPGYISPEQWNDCRSVDPRSDLYSLGCALFELLTGRLPFNGPGAAEFMEQHLCNPLPDFEASPAMRAIVERLLRKDPDERFQTAAALARSLAAWEDASE